MLQAPTISTPGRCRTRARGDPLPRGARRGSAGRTHSEVSLNVPHWPTFQGRVSIPGSYSCVENRTVILYAFGTGGRRYEFGRGHTNAKGKWDVSDQLDGATTFQARVKAGDTQYGVRCQADSSKMKSIRP